MASNVLYRNSNKTVLDSCEAVWCVGAFGVIVHKMGLDRWWAAMEEWEAGILWLCKYGRILGGEGPEHENRKSKSKIHNLLKYFDLLATYI